MTGHRELSILIVEDESLIAFQLEDEVMGLGHAVPWVAADVESALAIVNAHAAAIDVALLDANLSGRSSRPIADALVRADVPFALVSGYACAHLERLGLGKGVIRIEKPFRTEELANALRSLSR